MIYSKFAGTELELGGAEHVLLKVRGRGAGGGEEREGREGREGRGVDMAGGWRWRERYG